MPNRILKESICTSESIEGLSWFQEVVFYRLIVNADDYGRLDGRVKILQSKLFPLRRDITDKQLCDALDVLTTAGMVQVYIYDQRPYLQLTAWEDHQQQRAKKSKYPQPPEDDINCNQMISYVTVIQSLSESNPNPKRIPRTRVKTPKTPKAEGFVPPTLEQVSDYCKERNNSVDPKKFYDYFTTSGWIDSQGKPVKNWKQKVITWEGMQQNQQPKKTNAIPGGSSYDISELEEMIDKGVMT